MMPTEDLWLFDLSGQHNGIQVTARALARGDTPLKARRALRRKLAAGKQSDLQAKDAGNATESALHETQTLSHSIKAQDAIIGPMACVDRRAAAVAMQLVQVPKVTFFDRAIAAEPPFVPSEVVPWLVDPVASDDDLPDHLYALIDAGRVPGLLERLESSGLDMICLFQSLTIPKKLRMTARSPGNFRTNLPPSRFKT